jgi:hypothetical protein
MWAFENDFRNVQMAFSIWGNRGYLCPAWEKDRTVAYIAHFASSKTSRD